MSKYLLHNIVISFVLLLLLIIQVAESETIRKASELDKTHTTVNLRSYYSKLDRSQVYSLSNIAIREKHDKGFVGYSTINHSYKKESIRNL